MCTNKKVFPTEWLFSKKEALKIYEYRFHGHTAWCSSSTPTLPFSACLSFLIYRMGITGLLQGLNKLIHILLLLLMIITWKSPPKGILRAIKNSAVIQSWLPSFLSLSNAKLFPASELWPLLYHLRNLFPSLVHGRPPHPWALGSDVTSSEGPS